MTWRKNPAADSADARRRPPVVRRRQRQPLVGLRQHDLPRLPPDAPSARSSTPRPARPGPNDRVGGLVWQNSGTLPGPLQPLAGDAICAKLHFDPVNAQPLLRVQRGQSHPRHRRARRRRASAPASSTRTTTAPKTPGGGDVLNLFPALRPTDQAGQRLHRLDRRDELQPLLRVLDRPGQELVGAGAREQRLGRHERVRLGAGRGGRDARARVVRDREDRRRRLGRRCRARSPTQAPRPRTRGTATPRSSRARTRRAPTDRRRRGSRRSRCTTARSATPALGCTTEPDRRPADGRLLRLRRRRDGGLRIVYNDTTNEFDGAGLFFTRQIAGTTVDGTTITGQPAATRSPTRPATPSTRTTRRAGVGPNLPQLDLTGLKVIEPERGDAARPDDGRRPVAARCRRPGRRRRSGSSASRRSGPCRRRRRTSTTSSTSRCRRRPTACRSSTRAPRPARATTPTNCKIFQYRGEQAVTGSISGNTITIDVPVKTGFGVPDRRSERSTT